MRDESGEKKKKKKRKKRKTFPPIRSFPRESLASPAEARRCQSAYNIRRSVTHRLSENRSSSSERNNSPQRSRIEKLNSIRILIFNFRFRLFEIFASKICNVLKVKSVKMETFFFAFVKNRIEKIYTKDSPRCRKFGKFLIDETYSAWEFLQFANLFQAIEFRFRGGWRNEEINRSTFPFYVKFQVSFLSSRLIQFQRACVNTRTHTKSNHVLLALSRSLSFSLIHIRIHTHAFPMLKEEGWIGRSLLYDLRVTSTPISNTNICRNCWMKWGKMREKSRSLHRKRAKIRRNGRKEGKKGGEHCNICI